MALQLHLRVTRIKYVLQDGYLRLRCPAIQHKCGIQWRAGGRGAFPDARKGEVSSVTNWEQIGEPFRTRVTVLGGCLAELVVFNIAVILICGSNGWRLEFRRT